MLSFLFKKSNIFVFLVLILGSACTFPDNIPDWKNLSEYRLDKLNFSTTTIKEFKSTCKGVEFTKASQKGVVFVNIETPKNESYEKIRVGFKENKLDWIEFTLKNKIKTEDFIKIYGKPNGINYKYSNLFDYYNYDYFNLATDKDHKIAKNFTLFALKELNKKAYNFPINKQKNVKKLISLSFLNFKPGYFTESEFVKLYPEKKPIRKNKFDTTSYYLFKENLDRSGYYKEVVLCFINGILNWVSVIPHNLFFESLSNYGKAIKVEPLNEKYDFYDFYDFIVLVNKNTGKIENIGIIRIN